MIKQEYLCICDVCGAIVKAKRNTSPKNEEYYEYPEGWVHSKANSNVYLCPECVRKLNTEAQTWRKK